MTLSILFTFLQMSGSGSTSNGGDYSDYLRSTTSSFEHVFPQKEICGSQLHWKILDSGMIIARGIYKNVYVKIQAIYARPSPSSSSSSSSMLVRIIKGFQVTVSNPGTEHRPAFDTIETFLFSEYSSAFEDMLMLYHGNGIISWICKLPQLQYSHLYAHGEWSIEFSCQDWAKLVKDINTFVNHHNRLNCNKFYEKIC